MNKTIDEIHWYALRITYSRELALKELLDKKNVESFLPLHYEYVVKNERRIRKLVPAVHNLIFVRSTRRQIDEIKEENAASLPIRYIMNRETNSPIVVPDCQMKDFIAVAGTDDQQVVYLPPVDLSMTKGERVHITGGVFEGVEGYFIRVRGDRRVVVSIPGVMAVATAFIHPSLIVPVNS